MFDEIKRFGLEKLGKAPQSELISLGSMPGRGSRG
jgi:hypothetical protein